MAVTITREVTTIDQRTGRRLGLSAEKVNEVIRVWAEEYLRFERESEPAQTAAKSAKSRTRTKPPVAQTEIVTDETEPVS